MPSDDVKRTADEGSRPSNLVKLGRTRSSGKTYPLLVR